MGVAAVLAGWFSVASFLTGLVLLGLVRILGSNLAGDDRAGWKLPFVMFTGSGWLWGGISGRDDLGAFPVCSMAVFAGWFSVGSFLTGLVLLGLVAILGRNLEAVDEAGWKLPFGMFTWGG